MMWYKSCPRCAGDLQFKIDVWGEYVSCLQCGHTLTEQAEVFLRQRFPQGKAAQPSRTLHKVRYDPGEEPAFIVRPPLESGLDDETEA